MVLDNVIAQLAFAVNAHYQTNALEQAAGQQNLLDRIVHAPSHFYHAMISGQYGEADNIFNALLVAGSVFVVVTGLFVAYSLLARRVDGRDYSVHTPSEIRKQSESFPNEERAKAARSDRVRSNNLYGQH